MRVGEPLRTLVVEVGQRARLELLGSVGVLGQNPVWVAGDDLRLDSAGLSQARRRSSSFLAACPMRIARGSAA
jgi:hypothetical protein